MDANETDTAEQGGRGGWGILALVTLLLFTDLLSYELVVPILSDYAGAWNIGEAQLGLLFSTHELAMLLALPFAAWLSDRFGAVRGLQFGAAGLFLSQVLYVTANGAAMLFAARGLQGVASGIVMTAGLALLAAGYPAGRRGQALGTAMGGMSLGTLLGPPLGGFLFTRGGPTCPFLVMAGWALVLTIGLAFLPGRRFRAATEARPSLLSGWRDYLGTAIVVAMGAAFISALEPTLPLHLKERLRATPTECGLLFGLGALAYGVFAPLAGWAAERWGERRVMLAGLIACMLTLPLIALPRSWIGQALTLAAFGISFGCLLTPTLPAIASVCEKRKPPAFGAAYASFNFAYSLGMAIGHVTGGVLMRTVGFGLTLLTFSVVSLFVLPLLVAGSRAAKPSLS